MTRADVISYLRGLDAAALHELRQDAAIAVGWRGWDDDGREVCPDDDDAEGDSEADPEDKWVASCDTLTLETLNGKTCLSWERRFGRWTLYYLGGGAPRRDRSTTVKLADLEDAAEGAGYRLPWRPAREPR